MKIEIDLNDILGDEYGAESLQESVKRQVLEKLVSSTRERVAQQIDDTVTKTINDELVRALQEKMPAIIDDVLHVEYTPVGQYGSKGKPTTFRAELIKGIAEQMEYKTKGWGNERNIFTKTVDDAVSENLNLWKKEFNAHINEKFRKDALEYAVKQLEEKLGLKAA